ncbi:MAG: tRNA pseudouridine(13) synthase TruD [Gammaproteobacteria bacterium]|nr:tRNA pseudouridine(13) synthase TruD [Gammaproteobacteria bacterium]
MTTLSLYDWARITVKPAGTAKFRSLLEDFVVEETLRFEPSNEGAHHLLYIEKQNVNTDIVCHKLRRFADVKPLDIGYAGKKDRFAIARQWFSVQLPMLKEIDWQAFNDDEVTVLEATRHDKKLRIGAVKENHFTITLRDFVGDKSLLAEKLNTIQEKGFPNYFGEQRFGHNGDNLTRGLDLLASNKRLKNRNLQGLLFSAVRSALFNHQVSQRVETGHFNELLLGDYVQLDGSESGFVVEDLAKEVARYEQKDIHPCASLPGRGRSKLQQDALTLEDKDLLEFAEVIDGLGRKGLQWDTRSIRVFPKSVILNWLDEDTIKLEFSLPKGAFATSFLRELFDLKQTINDSDKQ